MSLKSFKNAATGILTAIKGGKNLRFICVFFVLTIILGFIVRLSSTEWAIVLICCAVVISTEMINSGIECSIDLCTKEYSELAKKAKDMAAGATLVVSIFSAVIGLIIFVPRIIDLFKG